MSDAPSRTQAPGIGVHVVAALVIALGPEIPALSTAVGFERWARILLATALLGAACARHVHGDHRARRMVRAGAIVAAAALQLVLLLGTGRPGSLLWALYLIALWQNARAREHESIATAVAFLVPPLATAGFALLPDRILAVPLCLSLAGPVLHLVLRARARTIHELEREAARLRLEAAAGDAEAERTRLLVDVDARLRARLAEVAEASSRVADPEADTAVPAGSVAVRTREVLHELRDAIWALDPNDESWDSVEPHLRRIAADRGFGAWTSEVPATRRVQPATKLALLRRLRSLSARTADRVRTRLIDGAIALELEEGGVENR